MVHLVGFTTGMYYDARTYERQQELTFWHPSFTFKF
jgi:hypothetical protein